ncbi:uncharacterized protein STEHIDRAFT_169389 [Stereum hirsutum FP-91666 SS1]|uniref:uncharacterized protein n=1 Tax=Stereum hirsutum (strain FP-91666) TaxID=721885 RepID=UPI0004449AF5|nr:uncharacterized protein STEHIDRAFT_169389 [Stereum hirsutum FP-91666 SS1]EIM85481.1 hypothetical protein STEHIDRAFT_169389 [Stereum hirsutum FP-91666 SS1]
MWQKVIFYHQILLTKVQHTCQLMTRKDVQSSILPAQMWATSMILLRPHQAVGPTRDQSGTLAPLPFIMLSLPMFITPKHKTNATAPLRCYSPPRVNLQHILPDPVKFLLSMFGS